MKYYQTDQLQKMINWEKIMDLLRYAGGHDDQMISLFKDSVLVGHWNEGDYQGEVATCVCLSDGKYAIYNDYYGSCSGCDAWEGATDDEVRAMCIGLSNDAYVFESLTDVVDYLTTKDKDKYSWNGKCSEGLLKSIQDNISAMRDLKISKITK